MARSIVEAARDEGLDARLMGGLAIWERCPSARRNPLGAIARSGDIDLVVSSRHRRKFERMMSDGFGLLIDPWLAAIPENHVRFYLPSGKRICDVTYDRMIYCHAIDLRTRLTADGQNTTIPLAELLLSKLQIVEPSEKDLLDAIAIAVDHDFGGTDGESINLPVIRRRCASDWALEYTVHRSTHRICRTLLEMTTMARVLQIDTCRRFIKLLNTLHIDLKPLPWRIRAACGVGKFFYRKWYSVPISYPDPPVDELRKIT